MKKQKLTAKAFICLDLLKGKRMSIKTAYNDYGVTNLPREISRQVEKCFGVVVDRKRRNGVSRCGQHCTWFEYKLLKTKENKEGIEKMELYLKEIF